MSHRHGSCKPSILLTNRRDNFCDKAFLWLTPPRHTVAPGSPENAVNNIYAGFYPGLPYRIMRPGIKFIREGAINLNKHA